MIGRIALAAFLACAALVPAAWPHAGAAHAPRTRVVAAPGVPAPTVQRVANELRGARPRVDADFRWHDNRTIVVRLYATHAAFARALRRSEGVSPESSEDSSGNIVRGVLPLGPATPLLAHNLVHVYTEWVIDRLTGNASDRQPDPAWLYDGLAEWEADRRGPSLPCALPGNYPVPLRTLATADAWWRTRAGPFGSLAYCEARTAAGRIISRLGWAHVVATLHRTHSWPAFARAVAWATMPSRAATR